MAYSRGDRRLTIHRSQWDRRLAIVDKYNEKKIYFDYYYGRFFTGDFLNQMTMVYGGIFFPNIEDDEVSMITQKYTK